jgi:uncharacterized protein (TIGR03086 family)
MPSAVLVSNYLAVTSWQDDVKRLVLLGRDREAASLALGSLCPPHPQGGTMKVLDQFDALFPAVGEVVGRLEPEQLEAPTACSEFTVRGVLEHMIGGATAFAGAFRGATPVTPVDGDVLTQFGAAMTELRSAVGSTGALDRTIEAPFGQVPGDAFARFVVLDGLVHGWDISTSTGHPYAPPAELVDDVHSFARQAITPAMRQAGMFADATVPPADATPLEQLVALTGRRVERS